ncbi:hypothetical protein [Variovorax paradoxus]|uniref:DUF695 domain-containing protein n=1 Tax=Variovorax paradoxus TaxID=34073 RepID=A0A6I6HGL7_VARPD|nr:hypothetical protein [Variovorax paradoxus]QGW81455.1 hypothetical protein GOQ09_07570 [Variovorax paradoxus]
MLTTTEDPRAAACSAFWQAVSANLERLNDLTGRDLVDALNELLAPFFPDLAAEAMGDPPAFKLVLTAHGSKAHFEDLMALVQSAPSMPQIEVEAFRQRADGGFGMRMNDFELASSDVLVKHEPYDGLIALEIGFARPIPMDMRDHARHMSFIMLDHILGEYDFAVKVGPVDFVDPGEDASFDGMPLDDFAPVFDTCWRDELGHTGIFPGGEHSWSSLTATRAAEDGSEIKAIVSRNDAANALVARADLSHRISAAVLVESSEQLEHAQNYEDRLTTLLQRHEEGCCTHVMLEQRVRTVFYQVANPSTALAHAHSLEADAGLPVTVDVVFDPAWDAYRQWLDASQ